MGYQADPADTRQLSAATADKDRRARFQMVEEADDTRWLMGSKRGRRIVWRLLDQAGVFRSSFNTNALVTAFAEGNRNYGLRLVEQIHTHCPELYATLVRENADGRRDDRSSTDRSGTTSSGDADVAGHGGEEPRAGRRK